jgi:soluble lytic murein transglycosylase-like protein
MLTIPQMIIAAAQQQGVDPPLALEVAQVESGMNPNAVSPKGAVGVMQLTQATADQVGVDRFDTQQNINGGVMYLRLLQSQFGDPMAVLAAYNWGPTNVRQAMQAYPTDFSYTPQGGSTMPAWLASAPFETRNYVSKILSNVSTQYSVVTAYASGSGAPSTSTALALPGGSTSNLMIPYSGGLQVQPTPAPFSWGTVALVVGMIFGIGLVLNNA